MEQIFRNMLVFLSRAQANGINEATALCEAVAMIRAMLDAPSSATVPVPSIPEPPTNGGERMPKQKRRPSAGEPMPQRPALTLVKIAA